MNRILTNPLDLAALAAGAVLLLAVIARLVKVARRAGDARVVQVVALSITMSYSGLTSWQWATTRLHAPVWERGIVFAAFEVVMLAFAVASRENRLRDGRSGWQHGATLFFAALMSLMALQVAGSPLVAAVRFGGGPLAALLLFHSLLGLELRHQGTEREGLIGAALREARERLTARLGIGRRGADSAAIARSRAADRAVALASGRKLGKRAATRLAVAIDAAQHGLEEADAAAAEASVVARVVRRKSVADLHTLTARHIWMPKLPAVVSTPVTAPQEIAEPDNTPDNPAPAEPVVWTRNRTSVSGGRTVRVASRGVRRAKVQQRPNTAVQQPGQNPEPAAADTRQTAAAEPKKRVDYKLVVPAMRAAYPDMSVDAIAAAAGTSDRTVRRYPAAPGVQLEAANGTEI